MKLKAVRDATTGKSVVHEKKLVLHSRVAATHGNNWGTVKDALRKAILQTHGGWHRDSLETRDML